MGNTWEILGFQVGLPWKYLEVRPWIELLADRRQCHEVRPGSKTFGPPRFDLSVLMSPQKTKGPYLRSDDISTASLLGNWSVAVVMTCPKVTPAV